jgi:hypothetical protein
MAAAGVFARGTASALDLYDVRWMDADQIAGFTPLSFVTDGFVPFAKEARASYWAWWPACPMPGGPPVVYSPRDSNTAEVFAGDFAGFLFRQLLREMSDLQPDDVGDDPTPAAIRAYLQAKVGIVAPYIPSVWATALAALANREVRHRSDGVLGALSAAEATEVARLHLGDARIGLEFIQFPDDVVPRGPSGLYKSVTLFGIRLSMPAVAGVVRPFGSLREESTRWGGVQVLTVADKAHGPLTFRFGFVPVSHYNRDRIAAVGLDRPPSISIDCPAEASPILLDILGRLSSLGPAIVSARGVEPLDHLLSASDPWADLRWA